MKTPRTKLTRVPQRGSHDQATIHAILDEALIGHVAWVTPDGRPAVIPTLIARDGDDLLIHGSSASRTLRALKAGIEACVEVTHVDGLVPARWEHVRRPNRKELKATAVLKLPITEGSAKIRTGAPVDDDEDYALDTWAGVVPLRIEPQTPTPDPLLKDGIDLPEHVRALTA